MEIRENEFPADKSNDAEDAVDHVNIGSDSENVHTSDDTKQTGGHTTGAKVYGEPQLGMVFDNHEDAYHFYCSYARSVGFKVRKLRTNQNKRGEIWKRAFCCSCEGFYCKKRSPQKKREDTRFGCMAVLEVRLNPNKKYVVTKFVAEHTHGLAPGLSSQVSYNNDSSPMAQFGELCQIAHRITSEGAKHRNSYTFVKSELLKLEAKLKILHYPGQEPAGRNGDTGSGNHMKEDGVQRKLQDPENHKSKGRGKGKMKNAQGSKDTQNDVSSERNGSKEPPTNASVMIRPLNISNNVQGSVGLGYGKELNRASLCRGGAQFPHGFPMVSGGQGIPYHLPVHQFILPKTSDRSSMYSQAIHSSLPQPQPQPQPQGQARQLSSSNPSTS